MMIALVIASKNQGKTKEIREILKGFPVQIKDLNDFGQIPNIEETGKTFDDNAYLKASFVSRVLGLPALSDDSGLVVEALNGAPGIFSARYAGENATDEDNIQKLLKELEGQENRKAHFECVLSVATPMGAALTYEAKCEGVITKEKMGENGFGYDPVFYYEPLLKTFAQMSDEEKNQVSHRARALSEFKSEFDKVMIWLDQQCNPYEKEQKCHQETNDK